MSVQRTPMTRLGYERLRDELDRLKRVDRHAITKAIAEARAHGDLSENAEYHAAREKQSFIEGRIVELETKVGNAEVIDPPTSGERHPVAGGWRVDDLGVSHFRFELDDPPLDEALLLAGGVVLGVLGEVAVGSRLGDGLGDGMPVHALEPVELVTQPLVAEARHRRALYGHAFSEPSANRRPRPAIA